MIDDHDPSRSITGVEDDINEATPDTPQGEKYHGHPRFHEIIKELRDLHDRKNHDYASGGDPLGNFRRVATILSLYPGLDLSDPAIVAVVYAMKQLDAYLWMKSQGHKAKVEGVIERLKDIAVYTPITMILEEEEDRECDDNTKIPLPKIRCSMADRCDIDWMLP